jgi:hypothetical protein
MPWGELAKKLILGKLDGRLLCSVWQRRNGHAVIIDVWISAEAYLGVLQVEGRFERNVEGKVECAPIRRICR